MGKRILRVYLAKNDTPYSAAYAKLDLPASPWEVWDAMEKVRLQTDDILYMEVEDYAALMTTVPGKAVLAVCAAAIFLSFARVVKLTQPIEYRR